ncbi:PREDICTED: mitochondrial import inner membrane translocase subunit Tim10 B-like [Priapulus caudatus]|uniref:Mitochondrial import inner membrane translocase subunit n=1 Tax=Priapulus caudatus TaxID=37621 RepID=A0ABM1EU91_PRICU|nr:PREDICTED: mitochondrial import inner membrane translocase subunit Tim10 B-like [Priapulus caudatus]
MMKAGVRNFRDFLQLYNNVTQTCFDACVTDMHYRKMTDSEGSCIDTCSSKFVNVNHRMMSLFMELAPKLGFLSQPGGNTGNPLTK